jgi:hypothetical protein
MRMAVLQAAAVSAPPCRRPAIQMKTRIGPVDDPLEREADRVADAVVSGPAAGPIAGAPAATAQRKCGACQVEDMTGVRRKETHTAHGPPHAADAAADALTHGGVPLTHAQRSYFEPRFGRSLDDVRIHRGGRANAAAQAIGARAYTLGSDIAFAESEYAPQTRNGRELLAHELAHVVQQRSQQPSSQSIRRAPQRVALATEGTCTDPRAIAEAIPGALAMAQTAFFDWFLATGERDRARVDLLLRANFGSDDADTRSTVHDRISGIYTYLQEAQSGSVTFVCAPTGDPECAGRQGYVLDNERRRIHICPSFFGLTLEGRRWMLVHECAHLAGAMRLPEIYWGFFGPIGEGQCRATIAGSTPEKLGNADNYARLIWCLTRRAGIEVTPP